jgi:hypothetical protein
MLIWAHGGLAPQGNVVWLLGRWQQRRTLLRFEVLTRSPLGGAVAAQPVLLEAPGDAMRENVLKRAEFLASVPVLAHGLDRTFDAGLVLG